MSGCSAQVLARAFVSSGFMAPAASVEAIMPPEAIIPSSIVDIACIWPAKSMAV